MESKNKCWHMSTPNYSTDLRQSRSLYRPQDQYEQVRKRKIPYSHQGSNPGLSNLKQVAMPTTLSRPPHLHLKLNIYKK
jgi:hypothetical protein